MGFLVSFSPLTYDIPVPFREGFGGQVLRSYNIFKISKLSELCYNQLMETTSQPHDQFFKYVFSQSDAACSFLANYLPPEVSDLLDLSDVQIYKDSFVDKKMKVHLSDLVYKIGLKDSAQQLFVFILFEHKSYHDSYVHLQLLRYMLAVWDYYLSNQHKLIGIIPIVFYHGYDTWKTPTNFKSLFDIPPALLKYIPDFESVMVNLSQIDDEEIKGDKKMKAEMLVFKYIKREELKDQLAKVLHLAADISDEQVALTTIEVIFEYLNNVKTVLTREEVEKVYHEVQKERGEMMGSFIDIWVEKGEKKGEEKGIIKGLLDGLETALDIKFGMEGIRLMPELRDINSLETLQLLRSAVKTANSPQELRSIYAQNMANN